jgi:hypothetical protein
MKKIFISLIFLALCFISFGCSRNNSDILTSDNKKTIASTEDKNIKVGVIVKNNSRYRLEKFTVSVRLKDAAGHTTDTSTLYFDKPIEPQKGSSGIAWMDGLKSYSYEYTVKVESFSSP